MTERLRRAFHPRVEGEGAIVRLAGEEAHHLVRVLRLRPGDRLSVFDGGGREWEAALESAGGGAAEVRIGREIPGVVDPSLLVHVCQALCRPERLEWAVQKGTEVGASGFRLWRAARSQVEAPSPERLGRLGRVALEACKQSGRRRVPSISVEDSLPPAVPPGILGLLLQTRPGATPIAARLAGPRPGEAWIAVGPEGGLSRPETEALVGRGWLPASLGPRVLRTETAGVVACALALHAWGDLGSGPGA